jgi:uncharacterized protein YjbI with pentapeptide repeats
MSKKELYPLDESPKSKWGFKGKTFLDIIQIFGIPIAALIMIGGLAFYDDSREDNRLTQRKEAAENSEQYKILSDYIDSLSKLMDEGLGLEDKTCEEKEKNCEEKQRVSIAQARTEAAIDQLIPINKLGLIKFLSIAGLLKKDGVISFVGINLNEIDFSFMNLSGDNLSNAYLIGTNLIGANLSRADLSNAYLSGANLSRTDLSNAYLSGAYLIGADLSNADLSGAYLSGAYLSGTDLSNADLIGAYLSWTDLSNAYLSGANLSRADLSGAIGLTLPQILRASTLKNVILDEDLQKELDDWNKSNPKDKTENE